MCEPIGSFLIDQFAQKLLTIDPSDPAYKTGAIDDEQKKDHQKNPQQTEEPLKKETHEEPASVQAAVNEEVSVIKNDSHASL